MKFLNTKEQVLDIQLTQHGKKLLSEGHFKPEFYAFYDDDILYDSNFADFDEDQSETENRILNKTPRLATQYNFSNVEVKQGTVWAYAPPGHGGQQKWKTSVDREVNILEIDRDFRMKSIGNSKINSRYAPAWNIFYLNGELTGSTTFTTGSTSGAVEEIPQLNSEVEIEIVIEHYDLPIAPSDPGGVPQSVRLNSFESLTEHGNDLDDGVIRSSAFNDGTMLVVKDEYILLELGENNTEFLRDNFDIEVFKIVPSHGSNIEELEKLYFQEEFNNIKDGVLTDDKPNASTRILTPNFVEYFFDILFDEEISIEAYCAAKNKDKSDNPYTDTEMFECPDVAGPAAASEKAEQVNIYDIPSDPNEEPC